MSQWGRCCIFINVCVCTYVLSVCVPGCKDESMGPVLKKLFETPYFRITVVPDAETVELCGALKVSVISHLFHFCHSSGFLDHNFYLDRHHRQRGSAALC